MRLCETTRELTYENFVEIFGKEPICEFEVVSQDLKKGSNMLGRPVTIASPITKSLDSKKCRNMDKTVSEDARRRSLISPPSTEEESQFQVIDTAMDKMSKHMRNTSVYNKENRGSTAEVAKHVSLKRSKSATLLGNKSPSANCLSPMFTLTLHSKMERIRPRSIAMDSLPISKLNSADYRGFLCAMNEKKNKSTRYWCLLMDSCLYCYSNKSEDFASDVIPLGGYRLATTQTESNVPYIITLERSGKRSHTFHADNAKSYKKWMLVLDSSLSTNTNATPKSKCSTSSTEKTHRKPALVRRSVSYDADVVKSRAKLLEIVQKQQTKLLKEQEMLKTMSETPPEKSLILSTSNTPTSSMASLTQSEDYGYSSAADLLDNDDCHLNSPPSRSQRSMSAVSVGSVADSLSSIAEDGNKAKVSQKVLAEIEEFRVFSQKTLLRKNSKDIRS